MLKKAIYIVAVCALATTSVQAQQSTSRPTAGEVEGDTLAMTCAQATALILSKEKGISLRTGQNRFDRYVHDGYACGTNDDKVPAFVRTKDVKVCHIGYTCEPSLGD